MARSHFATRLASLSFLLLSLWTTVFAYEVEVTDLDYSRQVCSGMWASQKTYINVTFDASSSGQVAMVIYEWKDFQYLGKVTSEDDDTLPKTYVCTSDAMGNGFCGPTDLGRFIINLPPNTNINSTSFWSARVDLSGKSDTTPAESISANGFWDNPAGNPTPPDSNYTTPWRRDTTALNESPSGIYAYTQSIQYLVRKTGYYCVAIVPLTVEVTVPRQVSEGPHPPYKGIVFFQNKFDGKLPATDYPKVNFYFAMFMVYSALGLAWAWLCYKNLIDLLPIQYYLSGLVGLLVIEMAANWVYYRYINAHGENTAALVFLFVVAILDSGRNAMSFFMLLVVSLGLSVVRESLDRTMLKCQILAVAHFIFGVLYAVGIVELELESTTALVLLLFVIPLAFTLSGFLLWIMYSLNATISQLRARKQRYKLSMFERLHRILLLTVVIIAAFFVVSSLSFSGRMAEDYAAKSWKVRWWLLDGWLALLYLAAFTSIAFLWRPVFSTLAMSDEIAQDEEDADDYDPESLELHPRRRLSRESDDDDATLVGGRRGGPGPMPSDEVVFEIGDEDEDDNPTPKKHGRLSGENHNNGDEREGLMRNRDD